MRCRAGKRAEISSSAPSQPAKGAAQGVQQDSLRHVPGLGGAEHGVEPGPQGAGQQRGGFAPVQHTRRRGAGQGHPRALQPEAVCISAGSNAYGHPAQETLDRLARQGNPHAYKFAEPQIPGLDYSFSGLKTSFLYSMRDWVAAEPDFIEKHKEDIAASLEYTVVDILMKKLRKAVKQTGINHVAVAGGVSANNGLRNAFRDHAERYGWTIYIPKFSYTTDNAAMIGITGYYKYLDGDFCSIDKPAFSKVTFK